MKALNHQSYQTDEHATGYSGAHLRSLQRDFERGYRRFCEKRGMSPEFGSFRKLKGIKVDAEEEL